MPVVFTLVALLFVLPQIRTLAISPKPRSFAFPEYELYRVYFSPPSDVEVGKKAVLGVFGKVRPEHVCRSAKAVYRLL